MQNKLATTWQESGLRSLASSSLFTGATLHWQEKAMTFFIEEGFPSRKIESWRYTSLTSLLQKDFILSKQKPTCDLSDYVIKNSNRLVIINGVVDFKLSTLDEDLEVLPLELLLQTADETLLRELKLDLESQYFAVLNSALMSQGAYIKIKPNQTFSKPLHILHVHKDTGESTLQNLRFYVDVDRNAEIEILEEHVGVDDCIYFNNIVTQINLNFDARLKYNKLQRESRQAFHIATTVASLSADSQLNYHTFSQGAELSRDDLFVRHYERGSHAKLVGLFQCGGEQHISHHTRVDHFKGGSATNQVYRGMAGDRSRGVFDGRIVVHPGAVKSSTHQTNHNLLLSDHAEIDSKPNLEIYVDDISASHGATVGQLNENALFYLQSRGIHKAFARQMLISAFAEAIFDEVHVSDTIEYIYNVMKKGSIEND